MDLACCCCPWWCSVLIWSLSLYECGCGLSLCSRRNHEDDQMRKYEEEYARFYADKCGALPAATTQCCLSHAAPAAHLHVRYVDMVKHLEEVVDQVLKHVDPVNPRQPAPCRLLTAAKCVGSLCSCACCCCATLSTTWQDRVLASPCHRHSPTEGLSDDAFAGA